MKKLMLMIAGLLFVSVMAVNAQVTQDTASATQPSTGYQGDTNFEDMEALQSSDVPASLRSTLQGSEYSGWEEGKVYRDGASNEYIIVIGDEDAKTYRFDSNGQRVEDGAQSGSDSNTSGSTGTTPAPGSTGTTPAPGSTGTGSTGNTGSTGTSETGTTGTTGTSGTGSTGTTTE